MNKIRGRYNPVTQSEKEEMNALRSKGLSYPEIGKLLGRGQGTVYQNVKTKQDNGFFNVDEYLKTLAA